MRKKQTATTAVERARTFLLERIDTALREGIERLPTVINLASEASVAPATMLRAVHVLRDEGVLRVSHGKGIRIEQAIDPHEHETPRIYEPRWQQVVKQLEMDILEGRYGTNGMLPTPKQMRYRFGVSHRTLRKALDTLVEAGTLRPYRRSYQTVNSTYNRGARHRILLVVNNIGFGRHLYSDERFIVLLNALEQECARCELRLELKSKEELMTLHTMNAGGYRSILGIIIWCAGFDAASLNHLLLNLPDIPVAALMQTPNVQLHRVIKSVARAKAFSFASSRKPGRITGTYLRRKGHKRIAYISPIFKDAWARNRFFGLKETFEGPERKVYPVTRNCLPIEHKPGRVGAAYHEVVECLRTISKDPASHPDLPKLVSGIEQVSSVVQSAFSRQFLYYSLSELFDEAMAIPDITAWVAHNDIVGLKALEYLKAKRIEVPSRISLVGFDNSPQANLIGLSSYDYNFGGLAHIVFDYLLAGTLWKKPVGNRSSLEVRGTVIERFSSSY